MKWARVRRFLVFLPVVLIILLFLMKDQFILKVSDYSAGINYNSIADTVQLMQLFDLNNTETGLKGTFLEFGAMNCIACKRMESVVAEISTQYQMEIAVQFYNISEPEALDIAKMFGVVVIPMQVLLNREGKVVYKHVGYISAKELKSHIENDILK